MTRRLVLVRHGRTAWNQEGRFQGHFDVPLDDVGRQQAAVLAGHVAAMRPSRVVSSDLLRARQTAHTVAAEAGLRVETDKRLREFDVGARAGLTRVEFAERFPEASANWLENPLVGAETVEDVVERIVPAVQELWAATASGETSVAVSHGGCLKVALFGLLGWPLEATHTLGHLHNCAWALLDDAGGGIRLAEYNTTATAPDFASGPTGR